MLVLVIGVAAFATTFLGGLFALRFKDKLHLITGFSAGAILGVAFFDLLPEAFALKSDAQSISSLSLAIGIGFIVYLVLERTVVLHSLHENGCENVRHRGTLGASSLFFHSFLDGVVIGLAFQVSASVGAIVTVAILTHDFSDGINTVTVIVRSGGERRLALRWLSMDALAPLLGIALTFFCSVPKGALGTLLGVFCGFFLYLGASDLLPESHHAHPKKLTTFVTILGMALLYAVIQIAQ